MFKSYRAVVRVGLIAFASVCLGCDNSPPPPAAGEPIKLTPGMEQMKNEMINQMKTKPQGKKLLEAPKKVG